MYPGGRQAPTRALTRNRVPDAASSRNPAQGVEGDGGRVRDVEAADRPRERDPGQDVAAAPGALAQALALGTQHDHQRPGDRQRVEALGRIGVETDPREAAL